MSIEGMLTIIAENVPEVYKAGQASMVNSSTVVYKTAQGKGHIRLDDVSGLPHKVAVNSENLSTLALQVNGKNFFDKTKATRGWALAIKTGGTYEDLTKFTTDFIRVTHDMQLTVSPWSAYSWSVCYDKDKNKISESMVSIKDGFYNYVNLPEGAVYIRLTGELSEIDNFQIEEGTIATPYEAFTTIDTYSGSHIAVDAISPIMHIFSDDVESPFSATYCKSYGADASYNLFWDNVQINGARTNYAYAFYGMGWNDRTFYPKYDMKVVGANGQYMFSTNKCSNLKQRLAECGVTVDFSECTNFQNTFNYMWTTEFPYIDASKATSLANAFSYSSSLVSVDGFVFGTANSYVGGFVNRCSSLVNFPASGTIAITGFDFSPCTLLSKASITSIMNCLSTTTSGMTITFSQTAVNNAFTTDEWNTLKATRSNWTVSLK